MTERVDVDMDRLADFVGGALDDTPDAAAVRQLIDTDPDWAAAHAELAAATAAVTADLRSVGSRPHAVPEDVAARLDEILRPLGSAEFATRTATAARTPRSSGAAADARPTRGRKPAARRAARRHRPGTAARIAAGPVGGGAVGGGCGDRGRRGAGVAGADARLGGGDAERGAADSAAGGAAPQQAAGGPPPVASGRDYRPGAFAGLGSDAAGAGPGGRARRARVGPLRPRLEATDDAPPSLANVPPELARLTGAEARQACLDAIRQAHGGAARTVEFARFVGQPALIVLLDGAREGNGQPWVVVAGPDCGRTPGDPDELYNGPLA